MNSSVFQLPSCHLTQPHLHVSHTLRYKTAEELQSFTSTGRLGSYTGGGYVLALKGSTQDLLDRLNYLQKLGWIDRYTRAVMLEFSVYNANVIY